MDPLIPHMRNVFLFAFLLCLSNFTQASEQTSPENIVYNCKRRLSTVWQILIFLRG